MIHTKRVPSPCGKTCIECVVVCRPAANRCVRESPRFLIDCDDQLTRDQTVCERDHACISVESGVEQNAGRQSLVHLSNISYGVPYDMYRSVDDDLFVYGGHGSVVRE